ncbi:DUF2442 domain-containing protein, partial [Pseudomonas sp. SWRI77]|uniref:DUF2442 domain-containing protein n=1 Tax=Pseudomonas sp. SWRI77 TaxID=2745485 RepID=UPI001EE22D8A
MASMKRPRLRAVQPRSGASLELTFTNGQRFTLDMSDALKAYPGLAPLAKRKAFEDVTLGDGGWSVEWPALDIQIGADTLLLDALAQNAPDENTRIFIRWRLRHRMTLDQAAEALCPLHEAHIPSDYLKPDAALPISFWSQSAMMRPDSKV